jgi:hypothetical protein
MLGNQNAWRDEQREEWFLLEVAGKLQENALEVARDLSMVFQQWMDMHTLDDFDNWYEREVAGWGFGDLWEFVSSFFGGRLLSRQELIDKTLNNEWMQKNYKRPFGEKLLAAIREKYKDNPEFLRAIRRATPEQAYKQAQKHLDEGEYQDIFEEYFWGDARFGYNPPRIHLLQEVIHPTWLEVWDWKLEDPAFSTVEDMNLQIENFPDTIEGATPDEVISEINRIVQTCHNSGEMLDYVTDMYGDVGYDFLKYLSNMNTDYLDEYLVDQGMIPTADPTFLHRQAARRYMATEIRPDIAKRLARNIQGQYQFFDDSQKKPLFNRLLEALALGMSAEDAASLLIEPSRWDRNVFGPARDLQTAYRQFLKGDLSVGELYFLARDMASGADSMAELSARVSQDYGKSATPTDVPVDVLSTAPTGEIGVRPPESSSALGEVVIESLVTAALNEARREYLIEAKPLRKQLQYQKSLPTTRQRQQAQAQQPAQAAQQGMPTTYSPSDVKQLRSLFKRGAKAQKQQQPQAQPQTQTPTPQAQAQFKRLYQKGKPDLANFERGQLIAGTRVTDQANSLLRLVDRLEQEWQGLKGDQARRTLNGLKSAIQGLGGTINVMLDVARAAARYSNLRTAMVGSFREAEEPKTVYPKQTNTELLKTIAKEAIDLMNRVQQGNVPYGDFYRRLQAMSKRLFPLADNPSYIDQDAAMATRMPQPKAAPKPAPKAPEAPKTPEQDAWDKAAQKMGPLKPYEGPSPYKDLPPDEKEEEPDEMRKAHTPDWFAARMKKEPEKEEEPDKDAEEFSKQLGVKKGQARVGKMLTALKDKTGQKAAALRKRIEDLAKVSQSLFSGTEAENKMRVLDFLDHRLKDEKTEWKKLDDEEFFAKMVQEFIQKTSNAKAKVKKA